MASGPLTLGFLLNADSSQAENAIKRLQGTTEEAGSKMSESFGEARGSLMLVEESLGVHIPRHLTSLIAEIPGVGTAFAAMLPLAGVLAAIGVIGHLIEKHEELQEALRKSGNEAVDSAVKYSDETRSLELAGLKLDDQIAKLEHKPAHNFLAEAILEAANDLNELASKFTAEDEKMSEGLAKEMGLWSQLGDYISTIGKKLAGPRGGDIIGAVQAISELHTLQEVASSAFTAVQQAREKLASAVAPKDQESSTKALIFILGQEEKANDALVAATANSAQGRAAASAAAASEAAEIKDLTLQLSNNAKARHEATLEDEKATREYWEKFTGSFVEVEGARVRHDDKMKELTREFNNELLKYNEEASAKELEGQKETSVQMETVVRGMVETNLANLKQLTEGIEADMDKLKATLTAREAGLTGFTLDVAKVRDERQELQLLTQQMAQLVAERQRLESDKGLLSPADTANVNKYNDAIAVVNKQLQAMGLTFAKAQADVQHVTSEMMKQRGVIPALVTLFQSAASQQNKNTSITKAFTLALQDQTKATKEDAEAAAASFAQMAISHFISRRAMAIIEAIWETAQGLSDLAKPGMQWAAAIHFLSAAEYGLIAGTSGGKGRGGAASGGEENKSKTQGTEGSKGIPGVVGGSGGGGTGPVTHITIMGGMITNTGDMQQLVSALNSGGAGGTLRLNMGGTSSTIPNPSY
jgi:predicted HicB family RNase H-like nuclease